MSNDVPRVNTVFIHSRPARGVGVPYRLPTPARVSSGGAGRWVPPIILFGFFVASIGASFMGHNPFAGVIMVAIFFVAVPLFWFCWHWGFNDHNRRSG